MDAVLAKTEGKSLPQGGWELFAVLAVSLGVAFLQAHRVTAAKGVGLPVVVDDYTKLNFGERSEGEEFRWTFPVANRSDQLIRVNKFVTSCDCASVEPAQLTLLPGQRVDLTLTIKSRTTPGTAGSRQMIEIRGLGADPDHMVLVVRVVGRSRPLAPQIDPR